MGALGSRCQHPKDGQEGFDNSFGECVVFKVLGVISIINLLIVIIALFSLCKLRRTHDVSRFRFVSLSIVLLQIILCIAYWTHFVQSGSLLAQIIFQMTQEIVKYIGFYYCVYFFTAQAVEILSNKDNDFIYYTKLGLISTSGIQIVHCIVTIVLILIRDGAKNNFCRNNLWVMMRFLGLAVTFGFIFIGWRIQQSILNPLLNKQRKQNERIEDRIKVNSRDHLNVDFKEKLVESAPIDESTPNGGSRISYIEEYKDRFGSETAETINIKIKGKKKQLRVMWTILWVILIICFFEMILSATQRIKSHICRELFQNHVLDSILLFLAGWIGLLLWTWPLIYVYWAREYWMSCRYKKKQQDENEEDKHIEEYYKDNSKEKINGTDNPLPKLMIKTGFNESQEIVE
ncbi:unnamed protein product [Moneuplotes crassus]|uniref:Uncharacterized protein n=1 Tax=Euplotes crassus TaxID=5936 RepID=A0AAD1UPJ5_EUPCR|nr:unnamed protein product [Moneuplotes crassus]